MSSDPIIEDYRKKLLELRRQEVFAKMSNGPKREKVLLQIEQEILKVRKGLAKRQTELVISKKGL
ncbi:MAG: hypothetical protein J5892_00170 [Bacilli bacterium]|nr:hypothetical protein [Bacilli bacterium]